MEKEKSKKTVEPEDVLEIPFDNTARKKLLDLGWNKEKIEENLELMRSKLGEVIENSDKGEATPLELSDITKKKIAYLEAELERQKKLLEFEKSKNSSEEIKKVIENHIKLTEQTLNNLKNAEKVALTPVEPAVVAPETQTPTPETATPTTTSEDLFSVNEKISYQGEDYRISETPNEKNKNKYILVHPTGKPIYKLTREQLFKQIENGNAVLVPPILQQTTKIDTNKNLEQVLYVEKKLDDARIKYAEEYKKFLASASRITRAKRFVFGTKIEDSKIPPELKELEKEYEKATVEYGDSMFLAKKMELESSTLSPTDKDNELKKYKQNEIFTRVIIEEQSRLNALKVENLPPKEKGIIKKGLGWYLNPETPRWKKLLVSTALGTAVIATVSGGTVAAAGGITYYASLRLTRAAVGAIMGQGANKIFDKLVKEKSTAKRANEEKKLAEMFKEETFDVSLAKSKKEYAEILEREQKAKRNRLITKAMLGLAVGAGTSMGMSYGIGQLAHGASDQLHTSGTNESHQPNSPDEVLHKANVKLHQAHLKAEVSAKNLENAQTAPATSTPEVVKPEEIAIIQKEEGIEHAFRRQIEANTELAKSLGFKGDVNDTKALHEFSGGAAHRVALEHGYVDKITGEEIRIKTAGDVAYQLKSENGELKVNEMRAQGGLIEEHGKGSQFEKDTEEYEYKGHATHKTAEDLSVPKSSESFHLVNEHPSELGKFGNVDLAETHSGADHPESTEVIAARAKVFAGMEGADKHFLEGGEHKDIAQSEESWRTRHVDESHTTPDTSHARLEEHPEFVGKNPFHLTKDELVKAYKIYEHNLRHTFLDSKEGAWEEMKNLKAENFIRDSKYTTEYYTPLRENIYNLIENTDLHPKGYIPLVRSAETNEEFITRASQYAVKHKIRI
jgi:hypothetical protein